MTDAITVDLKGWERAVAEDVRMLESVVMPRTMARIAQTMEDLAQPLAPVAERGGGRLRASVTSDTERTGDVFSATVGSNVYYAPYMEYGTGDRGAMAPDGPSYKGNDSGVSYTPGWPGVDPRPFARPALYDYIEVYEAMVEQALRGVLG